MSKKPKEQPIESIAIQERYAYMQSPAGLQHISNLLCDSVSWRDIFGEYF